MQQRKHEEAAGLERPPDGAQGRVQVIDVGDAEVADHAVERGGLEQAVIAGVPGHVLDSQPVCLFGCPRLLDKRGRQVHAGDRGAATGQLPGDAALAARQVEQPAPADLADEVEQRGGRRVVKAGAHLGHIEVGYLVITCRCRHTAEATPARLSARAGRDQPRHAS